MATVAATAPGLVQKERAFFFYMAIALAVTAVGGFGFAIGMGFSSFGAPWFVHVHGISMMVWIGLYLAQNGLVYIDNVVLHRRLGMFAAAWSVWMVPVGLGLTTIDVMIGRTPPAFRPDFFLVMDWLTIILFAILTWSALALRHRPDWHKRLMLAGTINLVGPAWGRVVPLPVLGQDAVLLILFILLGYLAVGMAMDRRLHGRVHPAYFWGAGGLIASFVLIYPIRALPPYQWLIAALAG